MSKSAVDAAAAPVDLEMGSASSFAPDETAATHQRSLERAHAHPRRSFVTKTWTRAERRLPPPLTRWTRKAIRWIKGPEPTLHRIKPLLEPVQAFPAGIIAHLSKPIRFCIFAAAFVLWVVLFGVIISDFSLPADLAGYGAPVRLGCTAQLW